MSRKSSRQRRIWERCYVTKGNPDAAQTMLEDALTTLSSSETRHSMASLALEASIQGSLGDLYSDKHLPAKAESAYRASLDTWRELAKTNAPVFRPNIASTLYNLGVFLAADASRQKEAEDDLQESLTIFRELEKADPKSYQINPALGLEALGTLFASGKRWTQAEDCFLQALEIFSRLTVSNFPGAQAHLASTLNSLGALCSVTHRYAEANDYFSKALHHYRTLATTDPKFQVYVDFTRKMMLQNTSVEGP
jgi:tetratricopeptide (TPR) repeat protein